MDYLSNIGEIIKRNRIESGFSQETLSKLCEIDRAQLSRIEKGSIPGVTYATLDKILSTFGMSLIPSSNPINDIDIKPFVKWAGGKTQLLNTLCNYLPKKYNDYYEPFAGGGAFLFKLKPKTFYINDTNEELISAYKCFKNTDNFVTLISLLSEHEKNHNEEYYYKIRELDRDDNFKKLSIPKRAARMIYLNKTCFNGLYRVNSKGYFNVPSGKKQTAVCYDKDNFKNLRNFFKNNNSNITSLDFEKAVETAKKGDFIYFDPPYDSLEEKETFTSYSKDNFGKKEQIRLAKLFKSLNKKGVKLMLSNHDTSFIRKLYEDFEIIQIDAKRMINSNASKRGNVKEVIIRNYHE